MLPPHALHCYPVLLQRFQPLLSPGVICLAGFSAEQEGKQHVGLSVVAAYQQLLHCAGLLLGAELVPLVGGCAAAAAGSSPPGVLSCLLDAVAACLLF